MSHASEWQSIREASLEACLKRIPREQGSQHKQFCTVDYSQEHLRLISALHFLDKTKSSQHKSQDMDNGKTLYDI